MRSKLDEERREFEALRADAKAAIEADRSALREAAGLFERERREKEQQLGRVVAQLDEERLEFDAYRSTAQAALEHEQRAQLQEKLRLEGEAAKLEALLAGPLGLWFDLATPRSAARPTKAPPPGRARWRASQRSAASSGRGSASGCQYALAVQLERSTGVSAPTPPAPASGRSREQKASVHDAGSAAPIVSRAKASRRAMT